MVQDETPARRGSPTLVAAVDEGEVAGADADALEELLELGLQTGRIRALYGPGGEQAALPLYRRLPRGARARRERARGDRARSARSRASGSTSVSLATVGPGAFALSLARRRRRALRPPRPPGRAARDSVGSELRWRTKRYYMACLDLEGRRCLVVGGGPVGLEKARGLLECGARVTVVAPEVLEELRALAVEWLARAATRAATSTAASSSSRRRRTTAVNRRVFADAEARGLLCNVADVPELCSFILPAVHRVDPIAVAVSTGGASPALAQRLRARDRRASSGPSTPSSPRELRALRPWAKEHSRRTRSGGTTSSELVGAGAALRDDASRSSAPGPATRA